MDIVSQTPFAVLTVLVAPAILTNASSILTLSTSNRLLRAMDVANDLKKRFYENAVWQNASVVNQFNQVQKQTRLYLQALQCTYLAKASFAVATISALLGACYLNAPQAFTTPVATLSIVAGVIGVASICLSALKLIRATQLALDFTNYETSILETAAHTAT